MDTAMFRKISKYKKESDIQKLQKYIGEIRLNAEKSDGFLRKYLHDKANRLENNLKEALR